MKAINQALDRIAIPSDLALTVSDEVNTPLVWLNDVFVEPSLGY